MTDMTSTPTMSNLERGYRRLIACYPRSFRKDNEEEILTVLLGEQNAFQALRLAHRGYVLVNGAITMAGAGYDLLARPEIRAAYLEGGH